MGWRAAGRFTVFVLVYVGLCLTTRRVWARLMRSHWQGTVVRSMVRLQGLTPNFSFKNVKALWLSPATRERLSCRVQLSEFLPMICSLLHLPRGACRGCWGMGGGTFLTGWGLCVCVGRVLYCFRGCVTRVATPARPCLQTMRV